MRFNQFSPQNGINVLFCDLMRLKRIFNPKSGYLARFYIYIYKTPTAQSLRDGCRNQITYIMKPATKVLLFAHICKYIVKIKHPPRNLCEMGRNNLTL